MATTSIWSVKGWLGKVVIYIENPDKTENPDFVKTQELAEKDSQGLSDVIAYAVDCEKTKRWIDGDDSSLDDENEIVMKQYVSGINCTPSTARTEMMAVKKRYGKDEGIMAFHGYQSFAPGECTPQMAHEIGVKLAEELWGNRFQVLVATHLDKAHHLHNHFVVNSVSFTDGLRYHRTKQDYRDMREVSDRLCREYGLSVIEHPKRGRAKHYGEWRAEQEARPTYRGMIKADVDEAIRKAKTEKQFFYYLKEKGYTFKFGKDITIRPQGKERGLKLARNFGEEYTIEAIRKRILLQEEKAIDVPTQEKRTFVIKVRGTAGQIYFKPRREIGGIRGLYLHYCYLLGILPKKRPPVSTKQLHFLLREDLIKLDTITKETKLLCHYRIDTAEQLFLLQGKMQEELKQLSERRKRLRYQGRNIKDEKQMELLKKEIAEISKKIAKLREEIKLCDGIAARSEVVKEKIKIVREEKLDGKGEVRHEHIRRSR